MTSLATPIFTQALRKSATFYLRGSLVCLAVCSVCYHFSNSIPLSALTAIVTATIMLLLLWLWAWAQMFQVVTKADDLQSIESFYTSETAKFGTSARFWVAESRDHGGIIGCLALKRNKEKDEAELRFLSVHHSSTSWDDSTELLLQAAVKHARTSGFKAVFGVVVTGQGFLESCYLQQGFKQTEDRRATAFFSVKTLKLSLKK